MKRTILALALVVCMLLGATAGLAETPTLRFLGRDATFDLAGSPVIEILKNVTGYTMEFEALPTGEEGVTKMLLLLSGGTPYDIVDVYPANFDRALAAHAVMPLDDLLKNAPALMAAVPEDSPSWARVRGEDGKIYGIPQLSPTGGPVNAIAVRLDLLEAQGLAMPTTPDELYETLKALKAAYPDMIPLTTSNDCQLPSIISAFAYKSWDVVDGKYAPVQLRDGYKDYIAYVNKLYAEGLLDAEFPANDSAMRLSKFTSGKAVMTFFGSWEGPGFYSALETAVPGAKVGYLPFLKDANGVAGVQVSVGLEKICFIPKTAANPEAAIDYINKFMENFKEIYIGPEGVDHEVVDGEYRPIMPAFSAHDTVWWFLPAVDEANVQAWWKARVRKSPEVERGYMDTFGVKAQEGLDVVNDPLAMAQPNDELAKLNAAASVNWNTEMIKLITGAVPMSAYEQAVANWKADGGERIVEIVNGLLGK